MRVIDADAFEVIGYTKIPEGYADSFDDGVHWFAEQIDKAPTISTDDLRPVGKWISNHDGSWNCSECGLRVLIYAKGNYCPNCGAAMSKGE